MPFIYNDKVSHPKKKSDKNGEPTHRTKDKHQIKKIPNDLTTDDLVKIRQKYGIPSYIGMMLVPYHLYDVDDPPVW